MTIPPPFGSGNWNRMNRPLMQDSTAGLFIVVVLVVADELEDNRLSCGDAGKWGQDPGGEGVGVDGERQSRRSLVVTLRAQLSEGFALEECELLPKSEDGLATLGDTYGLRTNDEDSTDSELERLDALADRTRGHVEGACGRIEGAVLDDDGEGFEELSWNLHHQSG